MAHLTPNNGRSEADVALVSAPSRHCGRRRRLAALVALVVAGSIGLPTAAPAATTATPYPYVKIDNPAHEQSGTAWGYRVVSASTPGAKGGAPATVGDFDGDNVGDFVVGYHAANRIDLMSGRTRTRIRSITSPDPQTLLNRSFGFAISVLGDVSTPRDGVPDIAIGTDTQDTVGGGGAVTSCDFPRREEPNGCNESQGKAWVFSGATGGPLYPLNHPVPQSGARFGSRLGRAGDVNGDGVADIVAGAPADDVCVTQGCEDAVALGAQKAVGDNACGALSPVPAGCRIDQGHAFVFSGSTGLLIRTLNLPDPDQPMGTCSINCGSFGLSVQGPGDVNGDGVVDQLVGAPSYNYDDATDGGPGVAGGSCQSPQTSQCRVGQGRMYLFSGATGALLARIDDPAPQSNATFGFQDAAPLSPGDVNADGASDLYANGFAQNGPTGAAMTGRAWVFSGAATMASADARYADAAKRGVVLFEVVSPQPKVGGQFGWTMATTDYDRNGRPDLYVGSAPHHYRNTPDYSGGTYVFSGVGGGHLKTLVLQGADAQKGSSSNLGSTLGWGLAAPGDLNGDGEPDYLAGATHQDADGVTDKGQVIAFLSSRRVVADFDGDTNSDISVFRPSNGAWYVKGQTTVFHGQNGDAAVPADYDGDGDTDIATFRPSNGGWFIRGRAAVYHGVNGDIPVPHDYDGDGDAEIAVFRPSNGAWLVKGRATTYLGRSGDVPVPADYDGDGDADVAVFRPGNGGWYVAGKATVYLGRTGDIPVPAHYVGDASAEVGVFRPSNGGWYRKGLATVYFGRSGDAPLPLPHAIRQAIS